MDSAAGWAFTLGIGLILGGLTFDPSVKRVFKLGTTATGFVLALWSGIALVKQGALSDVTPLMAGFFVVAVFLVIVLSRMIQATGAIDQAQALPPPPPPTPLTLQPSPETAAPPAIQREVQGSPLPALARSLGDRVLVPPSVTPEYLWEQFAGRTDSQAQNIVAPYVGHWMVVAGDLGDFRHSYIATFELSRFPVFHIVLMSFPEGPSRSALGMMSPGEPITVLGRINSVSSLQIDLEDCELLK